MRLPNLLRALAGIVLLAGCSRPQSLPDRPLLDDEQTPVEASVWLPEACTILGEAATIRGEGMDLGADPAAAAETAEGRATLKKRIERDVTARRDAINDLVRDFHAAGVPTTPGGTARAQSLERALVSLAESYDRLIATVRQVDTGDPARFQAGMQGVFAVLDAGAGEVGAARSALFADPELSDLLRTTPACQEP